ncbi:MAG: DUF2945 domain-containing protein [Bdellovibrionaceae bacterium]|nr:DUF2945 domain-containing protein [Pseudobdellovibrionaceae bacterium]
MNAKKQIYNPGDPVSWQWMGGEIQGEIVEVFCTPVARVIKGKSIKRNGSPEMPAYLVRSKAGNLALKLHRELCGSSKKIRSRLKPTLFRSSEGEE